MPLTVTASQRVRLGAGPAPLIADARKSFVQPCRVGQRKGLGYTSVLGELGIRALPRQRPITDGLGAVASSDAQMLGRAHRCKCQ
jgi:hypothetical protein